jgi:hypothetical protein
MPSRPALLASFAARYVWWREERAPSEERIIAQVMNFGNLRCPGSLSGWHVLKQNLPDSTALIRAL